MTSKHKSQFAILLEDFFNLSKSMAAYLKPLVDHKSAKTEWGILNDQPCKSHTNTTVCGYFFCRLQKKRSQFSRPYRKVSEF